MKYLIIIAPAAQKNFLRLHPQIQTRLKLAIFKLEENPRPSGYKKLKGYDAYRIRVGDYRIIYEIDDKIITITIVELGHRRDIYK